VPTSTKSASSEASRAERLSPICQPISSAVPAESMISMVAGIAMAPSGASRSSRSTGAGARPSTTRTRSATSASTSTVRPIAVMSGRRSPVGTGSSDRIATCSPAPITPRSAGPAIWVRDSSRVSA
jgi:hypothetical protein